MASESFGGLAFVLCDGMHYTSYLYKETGSVLFGDSLANGPGGNLAVLNALSWFVDGISGLQRPEAFTNMDIAHQLPDSHSCAIAAINGIEKCIHGAKTTSWTPTLSSWHCDWWMLDILRVHLACPTENVRYITFFPLC